MSTETKNTSSIPPDVLADLYAAADAADAGIPVDPEVLKRIRERSDKARERIRQQHGLLNICAEVIRESRDSR